MGAGEREKTRRDFRVKYSFEGGSGPRYARATRHDIVAFSCVFPSPCLISADGIPLPSLDWSLENTSSFFLLDRIGAS